MNPDSILLTTDAVGGVWTYTLALARGLSRCGVRCVLAVLGPEPDAGARAAARRIPRLTLIETGLPLDWMAEQPAALRQATRALQRMSCREGVDTVHLHAPAYATDGWPVPVVAVVHSCLATWWDAMRADALPASFARRSALAAEGIAGADGVIAPTAAFAKALKRIYGVRRRIDVVPNGLPAGRPLFATRRHGVLAAGRLWDEAKGMAVLDQAAAGLGAPVWAAGPIEGPGGERFAARHLQPLGVLTPADLCDAMALAAIFAAPSLYEPFGLAVLEAAQLAAPLVLADIPTFRELWHDAAVLVPPGDPAAWHSALAALLDDTARRDQLGARAAQRASRFTEAALVEGTLSVHRRVWENARSFERNSLSVLAH